MNVFQLIKSVLDELYARMEGETSQKDGEISRQLTSLSQGYAALQKGVVNNYADVTTRFAYIYRYVTCHANIVFRVVEGSADLMELFERSKVNITCIGGGPGSDFLGILKYAIRHGKTPHLRCSLFDKEQAWGECWNDVDEKLEAQLQISTFCQSFDVTDPKTWEGYEKFLGSDLFTMIYFMSEINSLRTESQSFFENLFQRAKSGALILYVENNNKMFYEWFDSLVKDYNWKVLQGGEHVLKMDYTEEKTDLGEYYGKFPDPKLQANIAFRVCQKQ